jgi:cell cycle sensor histidine kinase DivJ
LAASSQQTPVQTTALEARDILRWHAGWAAGVSLAGLAVAFGLGQGMSAAVGALAAGLVPPVAATVLSQSSSGLARDVLLVLWALAGALACGLTGGVSGPLAIWCLTPMVAAVVLGGARRLAQGAALSLLGVVVTALAQADHLIGAAPSGPVGLCLGLIGVTSISAGLAAALLTAHRRTHESGDAQGAPSAAAREILEQQPNLILTLDETGRVDGVFGGAFRTLLPTQRLIQDGLPLIAEESERSGLEAALAAALARGQASLTFRLAGVDDVRLAIELRRVSESRLIAVLRDATAEHAHLAELEKARAEAESLNIGKSRFLANMSHELRTPLNAIMGFSDIMRQRMFGALPARYGEYADLIYDAGSHLLDLINDVLDMSKIEAALYELSLEHLDAREPVQAALRMMRLQADDAGVQLRGVLPSQPLDVDADRRALKQIALNLVSNALKFTPKGGLVTVSLHSIAGALELTVADTGLGIAASDLQRLGRPFEQAGNSLRQGRGTGLGLSLVRAFAELHGGEMVIESRLGEGTAVTVRLPLTQPPEDRGDVTEPGAADDSRAVPGGAKVIAFNPQR